MHVVQYTNSMQSAIKNKAESIKMQFGILNQLSPGNMYYMSWRCPYEKKHFWGVWL